MDILTFIIPSLITGFLAGWIASSKIRGNRMEAERKANNDAARTLAEERELALRNLLEEKERSCASLLNEKEEANRRAVSMIEKHHAETLEQLQNRFDETVARMQAEIQKTTSEMLKKRQDEFQATSSEKIDSILRPLNENIAGMKESMAFNSRKQDEFTGIFNANVQNLLKHGEATRASAERLANALRSNGRIQGEWGETVLTELLEGQGLVEGIHFDTQTTLRGDDGKISLNTEGKAMRPDVILHLDRKRDVIIDAKVSLSDFLNYVNAVSDEEREAAAATHVQSIERHVKELARKDYAAYVANGKTAMGYVIMFVPNTSALMLATTRKPDLWRSAMERNVYIADEQTLYAALKIVSLTWSQIAQAENHEQLYRLADEMMTRVRQFMERYVEMGKRIDDAKKSWEGGLMKLKESGQSIPQTCSKMIKLGVKRQSSRTVPEELLGNPSDEQGNFLPETDTVTEG